MPQAASNSTHKRSVIVGVTGASGSLFARRFLQMLEADEQVGKIHLVVSPSGVRVARHELEIPETSPLPEQWADLLVCGKAKKIICLPEDDIGAAIASGSYPVDWMAVVPCSMGTLARIAGGLSTSLIERAADVTLKERRPLLLALRDAPFNRVHLENMLRVHQAGASLFPIVPSFYDRPQSIDEMVTQYCRRLLAHLGLPQEGQFAWQGEA